MYAYLLINKNPINYYNENNIVAWFISQQFSADVSWGQPENYQVQEKYLFKNYAVN